MSKPYLVIGATRGTGLVIATRLLEEGQPVRVIARNIAKARAAFGTSAELVSADLTAPDSAFINAFRDVQGIVFTAAVPPGPASEDLIKAVDYGGVVLSLVAAKAQGFTGRFLYMNTIGTTHRTMAGTLLNAVKKNLMHWRRQADMTIRTSGLRWTIIRAGMLTNDLAGTRPVRITRGDLPLRMRYRVSRSDVAEVFLESLRVPATDGKDLSVIWGADGDGETISEQLERFRE